MIRWLWRAAALAGAAVIGWRTTEQPADLTLFARAGRSILTGHLGDVYSNPGEQAGPLQQLLARALTSGPGDARPAQVGVVAVDVLLMLAAIEGCLVWRRSPRIGPREFIVAGYTALLLANPAFWGGHPIEVLVPLCWLAGGLLQTRHPVGAAAALVAAATIAPWGVLGFPVVLDRRRRRESVKTVAVAAGTTIAVYVPLLLAGRGGSVQYRWGVSSGSVVHLLDPGLHDAGWGLRLVQGAVVVIACAALRWQMPPTPVSVAVLVTAVALLRVATDPLTMYYYWVPAGVGVVAMLILAPSLRTRTGVAILGVGYLVFAGNALGVGLAGAGGALCVILAIGHSLRPATTSATGSAAPPLLDQQMSVVE